MHTEGVLLVCHIIKHEKNSYNFYNTLYLTYKNKNNTVYGFLKRLWFQCQNIFDSPVVSLVQKTTITPTTKTIIIPTTNTPSPPNKFATRRAILEIWLSKHTDSGLRITPSMMCSWAKFCMILCEKFCNILYYRINYTLLWHLHLPVISNLR